MSDNNQNKNNPKKNKFNLNHKTLFIILIAITTVFFFFNFKSKIENQKLVSFSDFFTLAESGKIKEVIIGNENVIFTTDTQQEFKTIIPFYYKKELGEYLLKTNVQFFKYSPSDKSNIFITLLSTWFPVLLIVGVWIFIFKQMQGGGGKLINMKQSFITRIDKDKLKTTFKDVAGIEEAKSEVKDIVEFLKNPHKFIEIGGKIPRGILLSGSPGTGKTLLAKAIAGEAKASFFSISGSNFIEMFVGVGSSRVRDLFNKARANKPAIIFIDEIDSIGRQRGSGMGGGNDEREQTLNQLLVEMDGFSHQEGIIIIAATNRPDVLDPALTRPGRFDRQVVIPLPDFDERKKILVIHTKDKIPLDKDVDLNIVAGSTSGMAGANLANLVNEAALTAGKNKKTLVSQEHFDLAFEKIIMGSARKSMKLTEEERRVTAFHEAGHALVAVANKHEDLLHKVTIIPHSQALGITMFIPKKDQFFITRKNLLKSLEMIMGGRAAEDVIYNQFSTGASNDLEKASQIAYQMVCNWGMSDNIGPIYLANENNDIFLGNQLFKKSLMGQDIAQAVDSEVQSILMKVYNRTKTILKKNMKVLNQIANELLEKDTILGSHVTELFNKNKVSKAS